MPRLLLLALLAAVAACGPPRDARPARRVLVVGWDGATFELVDELARQGRLPQLTRLASAGRTAWLESTKVPISSAAWAAATTGHLPGETGVYDFFRREPGSYAVRAVDAHDVQRPPLWRILSGRGRRVVVFGVPLTWPPEPVNGTLVAGMLAPRTAAFAWPPAYADELRARGFVPDVGVWRGVQGQGLGIIDEQLAIKEQALVERLAEDDWSMAWVVFKSLDVLSHFRYDGRADSDVAALLERLDAVLGRLLETVGPDVNVLVVSDHGFGVYPYGFNVERWLVDAGYAVDEVQDGAPPPPELRALVDYQPELEERRRARLDLAHTRVLASETECEGHFGSLRLNVVGREPEGCVPPEQVDALLEELERALLAVRAGERALITRVWRGRELYPGPFVDEVPDLIFETVPDHVVVADPTQPTFVRWQEPRADHTLDGVFVAAGPDVARAGERSRYAVQDVAPIVLHLLDEPAYVEMAGQARPELLRRPRPALRVRQAEDPTLRRPDEAWGAVELDAEQLAEQLRKLRELGYAEGGEEEE